MHIPEDLVISVNPLMYEIAVGSQMVDDEPQPSIAELVRKQFMAQAPVIVTQILNQCPLVFRDDFATGGKTALLEFVVFTPEQAKILMQAWKEKTKDEIDMINMLDAKERKNVEKS